MRVAIVGLGAVGSRVARQLLADPSDVQVTLVHRSVSRLTFVRQDLGTPVDTIVGGAGDLPGDIDVVVLTSPEGVRAGAEAALERRAHVVSTVDDPETVRSLLTLDAEARERGRSVVACAAMAPGLSCVLARYAAGTLDAITEVHVASVGTGGPACARRHHRALSSLASDYRDGAWQRQPGGSGRELVWFPEPVGGADCYRAALADPMLLVPAFPGVRRVTARLEATRRDRLTAWLPMLRPPHPEGLVGAVRVEVRGFLGSTATTFTIGASAPPALAAAATAATAVRWAALGGFGRDGSAGLAELVDQPGEFLRELAGRGVTTSVFAGAEEIGAAVTPGP